MEENPTDTAFQADYTLTLADKKQLYVAYMPFIKDGGLFIVSNKSHEIYAPIKVTLKLLAEPTEYNIEGQVIWINPKGAQGELPQGFGIQFLNKGSRVVRDKIETLLAGFTDHGNRTNTM